MSWEGGAFLSLDEVVTREFNKTSYHKMKQHPYYNRPSIRTSYQIAAISIICLVILLMYLMVSEVVNDFTNNSIHKKQETIGETFYKRETIRERKLRWLKNRKMTISIY